MTAASAIMEIEERKPFVDILAEEEESTDAISMSVHPKHRVIGVDSELSTSATQICTTMTARQLLDDDNDHRASVDIIVALDVSGSMHGDKLKLCKRTLELLLRVLLPGDRFGLISYSSEAIIEFSPKKMTKRSKDRALEKIRGLRTRGCTNISAAIGLAFQEMRVIESPNEVRSVFFLTDGIANQGICDPRALVELTKNCQEEPHPPNADILDKRAADATGPWGLLVQSLDIEVSLSAPPITMSCFGYGSDHNSQLLRDIAHATPGGTYYFVENDSGVGTAFGDAIGGMMSVIAQNAVLTLQVTREAAAMGAKITKVHHDNAILRDNGSYTVTVGDFYAEETRDVLVEVGLATPKQHAPTLIPHVTASLAYTDVLAKTSAKLGPVTCSINRPPGNLVSVADPHVSAQWVRILAIQEMQAAEEHASRGDYGAAQSRIQNIKCTIDSLGRLVVTDTMLSQLNHDMAALYQDFGSGDTYYQTRGSHTLTNRHLCYRTQRYAEAAPSSDTFRSWRKRKIIKKMQL